MKVTVQNFQSLAAATIEATGLTVVVGPSDRGKSALLRAVEAALFNRPGDQFVRHGTKQATVTVQLPEEEITWEKGGGVNRFTVTNRDPQGDDTVYSRVGTKAPDLLQQRGFKDVVIGARLKDDGKLDGGETIRPQVARQFDRIFLLDESGPFLNEVLVGLSRLGVLQRAGRLCSSDLRQEKALLKTREADLLAADAQRLALAPIVDVQGRVEALAARQAVRDKAYERVMGLRAALVLRDHWQAKAALALPPVAPRQLPVTTMVQRLQPLLAERARCWQQLPTSLPKMRKIPPRVIALIQRQQALAPVVAARQGRPNELRLLEDYLQRCVAYTAQTRTELDALKTELKVCPVCSKPWQ